MEALLAIFGFVAFVAVAMAIDRWHARHPRKTH